MKANRQINQQIKFFQKGLFEIEEWLHIIPKGPHEDKV